MNPRRVLSHFYYNAQHRHQPSRTFPHRRAGHTPSNPDRTHSAEIHSVLKRRFPYRTPVFPRHHGTLAQAARALGALRGSRAGGGRGPGERRGEPGRAGESRGEAGGPAATLRPGRCQTPRGPSARLSPGHSGASAEPLRVRFAAAPPASLPWRGTHGDHPALTRPGYPLTGRVPAATAKRSSAQSTGQARGKSLRLTAPRRRKEAPAQAAALTAPRSRSSALAPTRRGRRSAPPPSCSRPRGGAPTWRRGGRRERRWRRRSRSQGAAPTSC